MICEFCDSVFSVIKEGAGGKNRKACFSCIPPGLSRKDRNILRNKLIFTKNAEYKLSIGCKFCSYSKCSAALEWHHPSDDKLVDPSALLIKSWEAYIRETSKCILLCANCHREEHHRIKVN